VKVTEHVEQLLRQGHKPKELAQLGFSKLVVTRVRRQLKKEKATPQTKVAETTTQAERRLKTQTESPEKMAVVQQKPQSVERELQKAEDIVKAMPGLAILLVAAQQFGDYKRETCTYQQDGLCSLWFWETKEVIPQGAGEPVFIEGDDWHIKPSSFYCALCSASLEGHLDDVENKLSGDPLSGAEDQFACKSCGSKGSIAAKIMCTKCGRETYLGWWPKKG
jgi:hypothetical protein